MIDSVAAGLFSACGCSSFLCVCCVGGVLCVACCASSTWVASLGEKRREGKENHYLVLAGTKEQQGGCYGSARTTIHIRPMAAFFISCFCSFSACQARGACPFGGARGSQGLGAVAGESGRAGAEETRKRHAVSTFALTTFCDMYTATACTLYESARNKSAKLIIEL